MEGLTLMFYVLCMYSLSTLCGMLTMAASYGEKGMLRCSVNAQISMESPAPKMAHSTDVSQNNIRHVPNASQLNVINTPQETSAR